MNLLRTKPIETIADSTTSLRRCLSALDLTFLGIGAIIGAGIFVITGVVAAIHAGPGIIFSYIIAGMACGFAAFCYAELASSVGGCGSAYGYAYAGFGELIAWIVGWDLILEYGLSVSTVSVGWSGYMNDLLITLRIHLPYKFLHGLFDGGVINLPACLIILSLTLLLVGGVKLSSAINNWIVLVKLAVLTLFIVVALSDFELENWQPFLPFGWKGIANGASLIFFAYIGFDAISTAAEEAVNPQRDLPRSILSSLGICTLIYIIVSGLLTGMVSYKLLNVASPISGALIRRGHHLVAGCVGIGAIAGLTTVMIALFYALSRVMYAMARDGLLPQFFVKTHAKTQTPWRVIVPIGFIMASIASIIPLNELAELVNVGTLFAFMVVCAGVLILRYQQPKISRPFRTPWMPFTALAGIFCCGYLMIHLPWVTLLRFVVWMAVGLIVYFSYSIRHSILASNT